MTFKFLGKSVHYNCCGSGSAILLIHGFLESSTMWDKLIPALSEKHKVITIDLPGHGKSELISPIHSMEMLADVVAQLLEHLQIFETTVVGHSMGGYVAMALIDKYDEKVDRLFLINSTSKEDDAEKKETRDRAVTVLNKTPKAFISMAISNLFSEESLRIFEMEIENLKNEAYVYPVEGIVSNILGMKNRKDRTQVLKNFNKPKYLIAGTEDTLLPISSLEELATETGVSLFKLHCGHMAALEKTANVEEIVLFNY